ncbi:MAG: FliI/YscN family ATPase, partial [Peptostreptococcaceae bacterium]
MISIDFNKTLQKIKGITPYVSEGKVKKVIGLTVEVEGLKTFVGELCIIYNQHNKRVNCEVVGFKENEIILMPLGELVGIGPGCKVISTGRPCSVKCSNELLGKVVDALGNPMDKSIILGGENYSLFNKPPDPMKRRRIENIMPTGIRAIDGFITCGEGQRIGIFAGSGVGKSTTLGMIAKSAQADVNVIALIGERGREVLDFIERDLGEEGMKKSVVVCATSDNPPLVRLKGALSATSIAEYFRDQGKKVILMMDSVTRFAMAQREVGLAIGEPPAQKGYTPSVFAELPKLMERTGLSDKGSITAFYTVLVDG